MNKKLDKFFGLKEHGTDVRTEVLAGLTTFFAMSYILVVNPAILSDAGLPEKGVYIATILSAAIGTMIMGLYANIPYAQAPGMGLNAFFTYTIVLGGGFTPIEALAIILLSGLVNLVLTVTNVRKMLLQAIPPSLQNAIGAGIGLFVAYIGLLNVEFINFDAGVPALSLFNDPVINLTVIGLVLTIILMIKDVKGAILIGLIVTTIIGISMGVVDMGQITNVASYSDVFAEFTSIFGKALGAEGLGSLFQNHQWYEVVPFVLAALLTDIFDAIGTLIGTGRRSGIFTEEDEKAMKDGSGINTRVEKGLFADVTATIFGSILGTSNVGTFVESSAGIGVGGRTGLTSMVTALMFLASIVLAPVISLVPAAATSPALVIVGILMSSSFSDIDWKDLTVAVPAFTTVVMTVLAYSISDGIALGFISFILVKVITKKTKEIHPIVWGSALLFILNYVLTAIRG